jgi:tungstate transport system permease protein
MAEIAEAFRLTVPLIAGADPALVRIVLLSLSVSLGATAVAAVLGLPLGTALAVLRFPGRGAAILAVNAMLGLPPVVVGLGLYLLLSRSGPLGALGLLFTPGGMVLAQSILATPIVAALTHRAMQAAWREFGDDLLVTGASRLRAIPVLLSIGRLGALTAVLAGFGRAVSEVGAILIVGGNIAGHTRTMTTAITLETGQGHLAFALALGIILILISMTATALAFAIERRASRRPRREDP